MLQVKPARLCPSSPPPHRHVPSSLRSAGTLPVDAPAKPPWLKHKISAAPASDSAPSLTSCATPGKSLKFSEPQLSHWKNMGVFVVLLHGFILWMTDGPVLPQNMSSGTITKDTEPRFLCISSPNYYIGKNHSCLAHR